MRNYVIINGVNSLDIKGLAISKLPSISKPPLRVMTEEIDGRDGDIITELGYGSYDKELVIGLYENYDINEIIGFFNQEGTIVFSNEDDKYYNFKIINQIDYEALIKFRTANVTLHCQPFKYPLVEEPIELIDTYVEEEGEEITLTPTEEAPMEITLKGNTSQVVIQGEAGLEAEGTSITLTDVIPTKENYIIPKGNTSQVQYSGKNLLPNTRNAKTPISLPSGTKLVLSTKNGVASEGGNVKLYKQDNSVVWFPIEAGDTTATKTLASDIYYIENALTGTIEYQCEIGTTPTTYEPYCGGTPSPNPDYPQDIHSVSGDNEIEVCGENLYNENTPKSRYYYDGNGNIAYNNQDYINQELPLSSSYTFSFSANNNANIRLVEYDANGNFITRAVFSTAQTKTVNANTKKVIVSVDADTSQNKYFVGLMINNGETALPYEPYTGNTYPLYLGVENLLSNKLVQGYISNSLIDDRTTTTRTDAILLKKGTYTFNFSYSSEIWVKMVKYANATDTSGTFEFNSKKSSYVYTFTLDNDTYVRFGLDEALSNLSTATIELTKGSRPQHISTQPITLNKIGNYQDKIVKTDKWYWYREIGKKILDGTEQYWSLNTTKDITQVFGLFSDFTDKLASYDRFFSNYFINQAGDTEKISLNNRDLYLAINKTTASTVNELRTWLGTHNTEVYYVLATPTYTEITDTTLLQQLNDLYNATIYGTTNISSIPNDLEPYIDIKYNVVTQSPSPDRPSAINVVSGTNTITIANQDSSETQTLQIRLGSIKLRYVDEAQDYIYKSGDKWYTHALTGEKTFVGNSAEGWAMTSTPRGLKEFTAQISDMKKNSTIYCDNFTQVPETTQMAYETYTPSIATTNSKSVFIMLGDGSISAGSDFRTWLSTHNTTVVYPLNTAVDTEITDTDLLEDLEALLEATSYNPETNITQTSNDKPFIIYAKALEGGSGEAEVINVGNIYAKPIFEIEGNGIVQVLIDNNEVLQVDTTNDTIVIDTENMEAINKSDNTLANRQVIGDYSKIKLVSGENDIKLTGNYTKGTITKYTRYL